MSQTEYTLAEKTNVYWKLSQVWNGKRNVQVTTEEAIEMCGLLQRVINPYRPLWRVSGSLLNEIIDGQGKKAPESKVLMFKQGAK